MASSKLLPVLGHALSLLSTVAHSQALQFEPEALEKNMRSQMPKTAKCSSSGANLSFSAGCTYKTESAYFVINVESVAPLLISMLLTVKSDSSFQTEAGERIVTFLDNLVTPTEHSSICILAALDGAHNDYKGDGIKVSCDPDKSMSLGGGGQEIGLKVTIEPDDAR